MKTMNADVLIQIMENISSTRLHQDIQLRIIHIAMAIYIIFEVVEV